MSISSESESESDTEDDVTMPLDGAPHLPFDAGGEKGPLKKGPWTSDEDEILRKYISEFGEGNWNAVQRNSGLFRCGKSCRLRWANHLRPDLKKGAFTEEEERRVVELHAAIGNKWAQMAIELPGRTDNEIKNFWNTRKKRRQRTGLPIYPSDVILQASATTQQQIDDTNDFSLGDTHLPPKFIPSMHNIQIPTFKNKNFELSPELFPPAELHTPLNLPTSRLVQVQHPLYPNKRLRTSEPFNPNLNPALLTSPNNASSSNPLISSSEELSSFQIGSWVSISSSLPTHEPVDNLLQTSPTEHGIVISEEEFYGNQTDIFGTTFQDFQGEKWGAYEDFIYPSSLILNEATPVSGIPLEDAQCMKMITECGVQEATTMVPVQYDNQVHTQNQMLFYPSDDLLLTPNSFGPQESTINDGKVTDDQSGAFMGNDGMGDCWQMDNGLQGNGQWNNVL